jgi:protein required for attachment to host cells
MLHVSYTGDQLKLVRKAGDKDNDKTTTYQIKGIRDMRTKNRKKEYLIHWKGYKVSESTWEPESEILKDITKAELDQLLKQYKDKIKKKKK